MAKRKDSRQPGRKKAGRGTSTRVGVTRSGSRAASAARRPGSGGPTKKKVTRLTRTTAKKAAKSAPRKKTSPNRRTTARKAPRKGPARKTATRKTVVARSTARKRTARKATARKTSVRKTTVRKSIRKKTTTRKSTVPRAQAIARALRPVALSSVRKVPALHRVRKIADNDDLLPAPDAPPTVDRAPSSGAGHRELLERRYDHPETSPALTGGDVDADWAGAYATGDEAPGGDNQTPDQGVVEEIGQALGVHYEDDEELRGAEKIIDRDKHRWDPDPASTKGDDDT